MIKQGRTPYIQQFWSLERLDPATFPKGLSGDTEQLAMDEKVKLELNKTRRKSSGNMSSVSSSSATSSRSGDSSPVMDLSSVNEVETHLIDMAEIAKTRRRGRSKSVPHIRRFGSSSMHESFDFVLNTKLDASSFHDLPTTTLCSTELWL